MRTAVVSAVSSSALSVAVVLAVLHLGERLGPDPSERVRPPATMQQRRAELEQRVAVHEDSPVHDAWANAVHVALSTEARTLNTPGVGVDTIDCRSSSCVIRFKVEEREAFHAVHRRLLQLGSDLLCRRQLLLGDGEEPRDATLVLDDCQRQGPAGPES